MVSLRWPAALGENVTEIEQEELGLRPTPTQAEVELEKSLGLLPPIVRVEMWRMALPEFVTETLRGVLLVPCVVVGKLSGLGEIVRAGAGGGGATPAPASETECGLPGALSEMDRAACLEPAECGSKTMLTTQKFCGWRAVGAWQVSDSENSGMSAPIKEMESRARGSPPLLVIVKDCAELEESVWIVPNEREDLESKIEGPEVFC